jgi:hypothetical protein
LQAESKLSTTNKEGKRLPNRAQKQGKGSEEVSAEVVL